MVNLIDLFLDFVNMITVVPPKDRPMVVGFIVLIGFCIGIYSLYRYLTWGF